MNPDHMQAAQGKMCSLPWVKGGLPIEECPLKATREQNSMGRSALGYPASWNFPAGSSHTEATLSVLGPSSLRRRQVAAFRLLKP